MMENLTKHELPQNTGKWRSVVKTMGKVIMYVSAIYVIAMIVAYGAGYAHGLAKCYGGL
jgi:hypothetical protein